MTTLPPKRLSLTLSQVFLLTLLGLAILLGSLFYTVYHGSEKSILEASGKLQMEVGLRVKANVLAFRNQAEGVVNNVEEQFQNNLLSLDDAAGLEHSMRAMVLSHPDIGDISFTHAEGIRKPGGELYFAPEGNHWEISLYRPGAGSAADKMKSRRIEHSGNEPGRDPTTLPTFTTPTGSDFLGQMLWSELSISEWSKDRYEVSVQKAIFDGKDQFLGVVRVGLLVSQLNRIVQRGDDEIGDDGKPSPRTCFLCDSNGRLVSAVTPSDRVVELPDAFVIESPDLPPEIAMALQSARIGNVTIALPNGKRFLATFQPLAGTQGWVLGVIASEESYLGPLLMVRNELLMDAAAVMGLILLGGALTVRAVQSGLKRVRSATSSMRRFEFVPAPTETGFRDIQLVLESIEQAKTAMRAMGKYVPFDLVRELYEMNREPQLGGEIRDLSILFTDIQGFTSLSEMLTPDELATALGQYLEAMTKAIHQQGGTIDKFIGDSVMAIWNAPQFSDNHPVRACAAALACQRLTKELFASAQWKGMPPLVTRCGLHRDSAMIGHFGAPDRFSYTALGDGVNLASRLESLNKQYGTTLIVSQSIYDAVGAAFQFRLLDRVAVKGKTRAVNVYELLGEGGERNMRSAAIENYEAAFRLYMAREFAGAAAIFEKQNDDPPSAVMAERCRQLLVDPPPPEWDGAFVAMMK